MRSPKKQNTPGASGTARKAPGASSSGDAKRGSASAPLINSPAAGQANGGAGISRRGKRAVPDRSTPDCALPGPSTIADEVRAEVEAIGERRKIARTLSGTAMAELPQPESIADRFRRLARELDEEAEAAAAEAEAEERRERDLERLQSPSAVLRRAQRDWPAQCRDVAAIAAELGIGLGECWRRVIKAGVDCLRDCEGEAANV